MRLSTAYILATLASALIVSVSIYFHTDAISMVSIAYVGINGFILFNLDPFTKAKRIATNKYFTALSDIARNPSISIDINMHGNTTVSINGNPDIVVFQYSNRRNIELKIDNKVLQLPIGYEVYKF